MKNLEVKVKVKVPSLEVIRQSLAFAEFVEELQQKDIYYLTGGKRLKLRKQKGVGELIYYLRENKKNSKESKYFLVHIPSNLLSFTEKVLASIFGEKITIEKERNLYLYKHTRIHLDNVKNLGSFLELETVFHNNVSEDSLLKEHEEVKDKLKLDSFPSISGSYSDLLLCVL